MALNPRELAFGDEYIKNRGNVYQAAIKAGYSHGTAKNATDWIVKKPYRPDKYKPELVEYIRQELERLHNARTADAAEVMEYLTAVMRGESTSSVLAFVGGGCQEVVEKPPDEKEKLRAAEQLSKLYAAAGAADREERVVIVNDAPD